MAPPPPGIEGEVVDGEQGPLKFTGYDDAIIGICPDCWDSSGMRPPRIIYSGEKLMEILVSRDGMDHDEAAEWISFNMEGAYVGPSTPIVVWPYEGEGED